ncbi:hypothetical protein [Armatimonas sp.]|uniref:hypothetical protein n=1 Tax=Armatimonas sp. TaxID=1872638 RepID=UPI0037536390
MEEKEMTPVATSRRDVLKKIGMALAASSLAALPQEEAAAQTPQDLKLKPGSLQLRAVHLDASVKPLVASQEGKEFSIFFAKGRGPGSVVVIAGDDKEGTDKTAKTLGVKPGRGKVVGGIIQVDLGLAAEGRCSGNGKGAVASFDPIGGGGDPFRGINEALKSAPILRR